MTSVELATWLGAIGSMLMVAVTGFGFRYLRNQIRASSIDHLYGRMHDIHKLFIQYPDLRDHIFNPNPAPVNQFSPQAAAISELMADFFQQVFMELDHFPPTAADGWRRYMKDTLIKSPALQNFVIAKTDWYTTDFVAKLLRGP